MNIIAASSPRWTSHDHTAIDLLVTFDTIGEVTYTAMPADAVPHCTELFQRAVAGLYGPIAEPETPPPPTLEQAKGDKIADLAAYRYQRETGGITVAGSRIRTDRESQAMLSGALAYSALNPGALIDWKGEDGWTAINHHTLAQIGLAVGSHVQSCFSREKIHAEAIMALTTVAAVIAYDFTGGW